MISSTAYSSSFYSTPGYQPLFGNRNEPENSITVTKKTSSLASHITKKLNSEEDFWLIGCPSETSPILIAQLNTGKKNKETIGFLNYSKTNSSAQIMYFKGFDHQEKTEIALFDAFLNKLLESTTITISNEPATFWETTGITNGMTVKKAKEKLAQYKNRQNLTASTNKTSAALIN